MTRIERLAAILLMLQARPYTSDEIARRFEISRRTVLRDVQALSEMGVPVIAREGPGGGYSLPASYRTEPLPINSSEAFLLLLALGSLQSLPDLPFRQELASLAAKLRAAAPPAELAGAERLLVIDEIAIPTEEQRAPFLETLLDAARQGSWLLAVYQSTERTSTQHLLIEQVYTQEGYWYCRAYSHEHAHVRTYRADRFRSLQSPEPDFHPQPRHDSVPYDHTLHPEVIVQLTPRGAARLESDRQFGRLLEGLPDGTARLAFRCPPQELGWYASRFAGLGSDALILAPPELRQIILELGQKLVETYQKW
jgi:predicted DNA-binding transcriptional regulator YafY